MSKGGMCGTLVDPKLVFAAALKAESCGIILAYNYPGGTLKPNEVDRRLTDKIVQGGRILDIRVLDHR